MKRITDKINSEKLYNVCSIGAFICFTISIIGQTIMLIIKYGII